MMIGDVAVGLGGRAMGRIADALDWIGPRPWRHLDPEPGMCLALHPDWHPVDSLRLPHWKEDLEGKADRLDIDRVIDAIWAEDNRGRNLDDPGPWQMRGTDD